VADPRVRRYALAVTEPPEHEPPQTDEAVPSTAPAQNGTGSVAPRRPARLAPIVIIVVVGLMLAMGAGALLLYNRITEPDRSTPSVVARQFLEAALADRDVNTVSLFVCEGWAPDEAFRQVLATNDQSVSVTWAIVSVEDRGSSRATVTARLVFATNSGFKAQRDVVLLHLDLSKDSGWRVCSISRE
jgi:hypothetical protein